MSFIPAVIWSTRSGASKILLSLLILFAASHLGSVPAQTPKPSPTPAAKAEDLQIEPEDIISVNTAEVLLPVTVRDASGQLIEGLTKNDSREFEDRVHTTLTDLIC